MAWFYIGFRLALISENSSIRPSKFICSLFKSSASTCRIESELSFSSFIVDLTHDLILFKTENVRSAEQLEIAVHKYIRRAIAIFGNVDWSCSCRMNNIICSGVFLISAFFISPAKWTHSLANYSSRSFLYKDRSLLARSMTVADGVVDSSLKTTKFSAIES